MKAFTLELSKEAVHFLQLKLPKGYSLVKTVKESGKRNKSGKSSNLSREQDNYDCPSEEFEPTRTPSKPKTVKTQSLKIKEEPREQTAKKQPKHPIGKINNEPIAQKRPQKDVKKSKDEHDIFDSNSDEDTNSEPKSEAKTKIKQQKAKNKENVKDFQKRKKLSEISLSKAKENDKQSTKEISDKADSKEIKPEALKDQKKEQSFERKNVIKETIKLKESDFKACGQVSTEKITEEGAKKGEKKKKEKKPRQKKYSYQNRLEIITRIKKLDKKTLAEYFEAISFSKGETLDLKLLEDEKVKFMEEQLVNFEEVHRERIKEEREKLKPKNPKSLEDFEVAEDEDYED